MIIPWSTDAPIYHWPVATVGLIVANVVAFVGLAAAGPETLKLWALGYGEGLHPTQWLTSNFAHAGIMHLVGNMLFLWAYGIIVEGKLGWWKFLAVYLGIGVLQSALEQIVMLRADGGGSLGASAAIFGLMAICLVWAPKNDMSCIVILGYRVLTFDIPIIVLASLDIALEIFEAAFWGVALAGYGEHRVATALLHLSGAILGFGVGVALLKADLVDCENWDLFAMLSGRLGLTKSEARARARTSTLRPLPVAEPERPARENVARKSAEERAAAEENRMRARIAEGDSALALAAYQKAMTVHPGWLPPEADWLALIKLLHLERSWGPSLPVMEEYLRNFPDRSSRMRLKLAQILVKEQQRPRQALKVLAEIPAGSLPENLDAIRTQVAAEAGRMLDEGVLELEGEAW